MLATDTWSASLIVGFSSVAVAQLSGWKSGQVSTTMCNWEGLRAIVLRDTVYLDGGVLQWQPQNSDGSFGGSITDTDTPGVMLKLSFSTPFNMSQNISALLGQQIKNTNAPTYVDGALLGNDDEFYLYGGAWRETDTSAEPISNQDFVYRGYAYGIDQTQFASGPNTYSLDGDMTKYIAYGAAANAPSENLAFYFSGMRAPTWGAIYSGTGNTTFVPSETSNTLITLDLTTQYAETWSNDTLPDSITPRASPEMIWVPVGEKGILVALGGVTYPGYVAGGFQSSNATASIEESPAFMTNIDVYDVSSKTWYTQSTTGGPGALAQGCAVMQPAQDYSSFNIYWYGGWDGLNATNSSYWDDAVWVLSLPSFTWTQVAEGRGSGRGRMGHKCVMPYPDQMMVIGGLPVYPATGSNCFAQDTFIELFNVSSATWLDSYDPTVYFDYQVPSAVHSAIGGEATGGATHTAPSGGWDNSTLGSIFQVAYATSKIATYYPYSKATSTAVTIPTYTAAAKHKGGGTPSYLGPVLGVILGLVFLSSLIVGILLWRRRKLLKKNGGVSVVETDERGNRINSWLHGQRTVAKSETITSSEELAGPGSPTPEPARFYGASSYPFTQQYGYNEQGQVQHQELESNALVELPDNSPPAAELSDTPMSPAEITDRSFSARRSRPGELSLAGWSSIQATDQGSLVSSNSALPFGRGSPPAPPSSASLSSSNQPRHDSSTIPQANNKALPELPAHSSPRSASGVSAFSERDRAHLRQISDPATVSTMGGTILSGGRVASPPPHPILEEGALERANSGGPGNQSRETPSTSSVVSPPTAGEEGQGTDYLDARARAGDVSPVAVRTTEPGRRSAFRESSEDMNEAR